MNYSYIAMMLLLTNNDLLAMQSAKIKTHSHTISARIQDAINAGKDPKSYVALLPQEIRKKIEQQFVLSYTLPVQGCVSALTPDGTVAIIADGKIATLLDLTNPNNPRLYPFPEQTKEILSIAISDGGTRALFRYVSGQVALWNIQDRANFQAYPFPEEENRIEQIIISNDGNWALTGHQEKRLTLYTISDASNIRVSSFSEVVGTIQEVSADGKWVVTKMSNGHTGLWDLQDPTRPQLCTSLAQLKPYSINAITVSMDGQWAIICDDTTSKLRNLQDGTSHNLIIKATATAISPNGGFGVIGMRNGSVYLLNFEDPTNITPLFLEKHPSNIYNIVIAQNGKRALITSGSKTTLINLAPFETVLPSDATMSTTEMITPKYHQLTISNPDNTIEPHVRSYYNIPERRGGVIPWEEYDIL